MSINSKRLEGVPVMTRSGMRVGKLASLELDADTGKMTAILVRPSGVVTSILGSDLVIAWGAVISMSETSIVVSDAVVMAKTTELATASAPEL